ncbi:hypothetical protein Glove_147g60 [Diversispora epigaea]|uniref:Retrotransposon gag domain-containing protein n=1 Tax=Diversispora epigaea TaxID=1348612 RepID=A0A397ITQ8_9GLOM|nr:hypothetical protein Glove_147g60 [Diversispora epigaea]
MVIAKRRNDCVDEAIKQKNEALSEIVERELSREEKDPNYEVTYTLKDLNRVKDHLDLIKHHVWIPNTLESTPRNSTKRTVQRLTPEEREQRRQRYRQRRLERQIQRENQNPVTVRLPASNSETTSPSATVGTFGTTPRHRRRSNETPQSFSQAVSPRRSPEQVTPRVVTPPNNWNQLQNIRTFYQPLDFNLINQQLAEANFSVSDSSDSSDTDTEDEMANTIIDYLENNLHNNTSLRIDPFYGDGTQDPLQWMIHFEKVARSNAWDEAKKIRKYATYLEDDAEEWHDEIVANDMADWAAWRAGFVEKYCNTRWKNKWMRELENNRQRQGETIDVYYARFKRLVKRVEIQVDQRKRLFIKGLLLHIAPLVTMQTPGTLAAALELAQAYEEGLDMVNKIEPRKQKGKKKVVESSDEEEEEEEEERKPKKTTLKKKKKETKVTFDPAHNLDDLAKKFEKMQLNLIQKMEKLTTQVNQQPNYRNRGNNRNNSSQNNWNNRNNRNNRNNNRETLEVEEESEKEEDKLLQHLLNAYDAYLGKRERDDSSDEDTPIKRPRETNIPEPKSSLSTFGLPKTTSIPVPKVVKTEITPKKKSKKKKVIKIVKGNKEKKKENATQPPLFRKKDFDIVEQLQNQPAGLSWTDALEVPSIRKSFFEALRKPKEKEIKLADQEYSLKTTALKCNVAVGVYIVPTIVDSGAAISIVTRDAMEQLGYEIEEASKSIILPATGKKTQPLGVIRDLPITIQDQTIPIDVEVIDAATYSLLLGNNWLMKANASYNWSDQELTLRWRGKTLTIPANCSKETKEEFSELIENTDEESADESNTETEESEDDDEEIIFKNTAIEDNNDGSDEDTVLVFLSEKLNKNELDIGQLNNHQQQKFNKLMERNKDLFASDVSSLGRINIIKYQIDVGEAKPMK